MGSLRVGGVRMFLGSGLSLGVVWLSVFFPIVVVSCVSENLCKNPFGWAGVGGK